ncbi:hydroxyacid dehydrogenase [archaeon]|jgi:D-lactate dehydrogenase|nr:hydroxyacid dehydrogenase [archaeon]MDP6547704.1 hydroxyacid dehydrogenase [Candidatus Woesearchaeota archaeon]|tara:strand:- start:4463 stop:5476 length:1014 start_codon:yes stop_codon:yes gene_type:complete
MPKKQKIAFFEIENWEIPYLKKELKQYKLHFFEDALDEKNAGKIKDADIISVFIYSKVNKKVLGKLKNLKLITTRSTGFDHIDVNECKKRKITISNVPYYGENTVAEHTFALVLNLTRKIHKAWERTRRLDFSIEGLRGIDLRARTLGVIGVGSIGKHVVRMANGFEMNVIAFDVFKSKKLEKELKFKYVGFDYLLKNSDIVTLHCPYNKKTHHMINKSNIGKIKKGSILINTSRGGLIETDALVNALDKGILSGAGLDVLEDECYVREDKEVMSKHFPKKCDLRIILENHILAKKENVIVTPHNAFNSIEALQRILDTTVENIKKSLKGKAGNLVK